MPCPQQASDSVFGDDRLNGPSSGDCQIGMCPSKSTDLGILIKVHCDCYGSYKVTSIERML
jgi:hypothetical protein